MNIFITGASGTGKSTICERLQERGYRAFDMDQIEGLCSWTNQGTGKKVEVRGTSSAWLAAHAWICDIEQLRHLLSSDQPTFFFGIVSNQDEILPLFDKVFVLSVTDEVLVHRLIHRTNNSFGQKEHERNDVLGWHKSFESKMAKAGATIIDASQPPDAVVAEIVKQ